MRSFLLLLGLRQVAAAHHGDASVCVASFWDQSIAGGYSDASNAVVIVTDNEEVSAGNKIELGAMITEPGAWMTIEDGAFVTIDTDKLDCGLGGCSDEIDDDMQLGYDKHSDELVSCEGDDDDDDGDDHDDEPKLVTLVLAGIFSEVVGDNKDSFLQECTADMSDNGATDVECVDVRQGSILVDVGGSDPDAVKAAVTNVRQNGLDLPSFESLEAVKPTARLLSVCPKFDQDKTFEEGGDYYCYDGKHRVEDYTGEHSAEHCNQRSETSIWKEAKRQTCGEILTYIAERGGIDGDRDKGGSDFRWQLMHNCCDLDDDDTYALPSDNCEGFNKDRIIDATKGLTCAAAGKYLRTIGGVDKVTNEIQMSYYNVVCCGVVNDDMKNDCPNYDADKLFEDGEHMHYCKENNDLSFYQCKTAGLSWENLPSTTCASLAASVAIVGMDDMDSFSKATFKDRCCGVSPTPPTGCPGFDAKELVSEAYEVCVIGEEEEHDYDKSEFACKISGGFWQKNPSYSCGDYAIYMASDYYYPDGSTLEHFKGACCPNIPTPPAETEPPASCPATCSGRTCDDWLGKTSFTCSSLEDTYGCNCGGCECAADTAQLTCEADLCFERTCPEWEGKHGVKCDILKDVFGCSCNGCNCAKTVHKCGSPEHKGDNYCDDDNNVKRCNWDGGDCCKLDGNWWEHTNQFVYCKDCECRDPEGEVAHSGCVTPQYQGDAHCDDGNNKASCGWDGGDCCGEVSTKYCDDCLCVDPSHSGSRCISSHQEDGFCDDANNNAACSWDNGDCCNNGHSGQFRYCDECVCKDPASHAAAEKCEGTCGSDQHSGDKYCDDDNNNCGCGWDGGDCCGKTGNMKQYEYCFQCACLNPTYEAPACPVEKFKGDGICDDDNNIESCDWDNGDCCDHGEDANKNQFKFCKKCEEHYC